MNLNGYEIIDRSNRPSLNSRTAARVFFMNDGNFLDPSEIISVTIFPNSLNLYPESILNASGFLDASTIAASAVAHYETSSGGVFNTSTVKAATSYSEGDNSIFKLGPGDYFVVIDGITPAPYTGLIQDTNTFATISNELSAVGEYIDIWTVKHPGSSDIKTVINNITFYDNTFYTTTQAPSVRAYNELVTKKIPLGSKRDIKILTELTIENKEIDDATKNLFKTSLAINPKIKIEKLNQEPNLPARVEVSGYVDTESLIRITAENTFLLSWDTETLRTHPKLLSGDLGSMLGIYAVTLQYELLNERIVTPQMYIQLV